MADLRQFVQDLGSFLEYKKEEGFRTLEVSPETLIAIRSQRAGSRGQESGGRSQESGGRSQGAVPYSSPRPVPVTTAVPPSSLRVTGKTLEEIDGQIRVCSACPLSGSRRNTVPGEGNPACPDIMFVGEGPGAEEDEQGRPFVGEAGQLLDKMIGAMGYKREEVYVTTLVKCRPPGTRIPLPEEMNTCVSYLKAQIALIQPKIIVALGKAAVECLLGNSVAITKFRGTWCTYAGIDLMPTYHPGYLLKSPGKKGETWADLKAVLAKLGKEPPVKKN